MIAQNSGQHVIVTICLGLFPGLGHLKLWENNFQGKWSIFLQFRAWYINFKTLFCAQVSEQN